MAQLIGDASKARVFAFIIDNLIACVLSIVLVGKINSENGFLSGGVISLSYLSYFFVFEATFARTPGKFFQGLIVRDASGRRCDTKQIFIRTLARIFEANPILFGGLPAALLIASSKEKQRLGDTLAGTVVVSRDVAIEE